METAIAVVAVLVALVGTLLQLVLVFEGLSVLGQIIIPFFSKERLGWFELWGGWHLVVSALLFKFAYDKFSAEIGAFQQVAFQLEGLRALAMYLVLPLMVSFFISRIHLYARAR